MGTIMSSLSDFLDVVCFAIEVEEDGDVAHVYVDQQDDPLKAKWWPPIDEKSLLRQAEAFPEHSFYMSTMIAHKDADGPKYRNKQGSFWGLNMIILDDIGS